MRQMIGAFSVFAVACLIAVAIAILIGLMVGFMWFGAKLGFHVTEMLFG